MNNRQLYLAWLRSTAPLVYARAMRTAANPNAGLAGLGDDLTSQLQAVSVDTGDAALSNTDMQAIDNAANAPSSSWSDFFDSVANAVGTVGPAIVQTQAQQNLLAINTQRAQMNPPLPPLTANGIPITSNMLVPTSATLQSIEAAMAGSGSLVWLIGGGVLLAILLGSRHRSA